MRGVFICLVVAGLALVAGCTKKIPVSYNKLDEGYFVHIETLSGKQIKGDLIRKDEHHLVIETESSPTPVAVERKEIVHIQCNSPEYDEKNQLISDKEIRSTKRNKNLVLFTVGGGLISFGAGFFLTANILHQMDKDAAGTALWGPTAGTTALGATLFGIQGYKIDKRHAIELIKEKRKENALRARQQNKNKQSQINQEMQRLKQEREKQNEEINKLLKKIDKDKKKDDPK
ncbi:hypothetical protein JXJ21_10895 [candidate division KSB1 bacterium]|nr:hypothetical protein [candidate division KSB1 bacterium]